MTPRIPLLLLLLALLVGALTATDPQANAASSPKKNSPMHPTHLRCEYLVNPLAVEDKAPRLSWEVASNRRNEKQTAYRILVASSVQELAAGRGDLWDSDKVSGDATYGIAYAGKPLTSRTHCFWKVQVWDREGKASEWSPPAEWSVGLLERGDWKARWISYQDEAPLHTSRSALYLPPPRFYRQEFRAEKPIRRAVLYTSALGLCEMRLNGERVGDTWFAPGWSDYQKRAYYQAFEVTKQVAQGANALGAVVAEGWYSGYVGYGLLVGYGPNRVGRYFYGKTPALLAQLEIEYADGSREVVASGPEWRVTDQHPIREADIQMGETYDARRELPGWDHTGFDAGQWASAILAEQNGSTKATFSDRAGQREVELGFIEPARLQAFSGAPIRVTGELKAVRQSEPKPGTHIFDFGQNFSGVVRLKVKGPAGTLIRLRFGEMLHPDGRLMTENLRRARATDTYILRGDPAGESWTPSFTYHGFQYVEVTGYPGKPELDAVTGVVLHSDTPLSSSFSCSDPVMTRFYQNAVWTQRANFFEVPTDCPQRDERLGWMGDAQVYARAATFHADVAAFFTKWLDDVEESQLPNGAYPDYAPYPMFHGGSPEGYGTAWMDAGILCPYEIYRAYGDTRVLQRHWASMQRFMEFRKRRSPDGRGVTDGNDWGDWLSLSQNTPLEYVDAVYYALDARLMAEMAAALGKKDQAADYQRLFEALRTRFQGEYLQAEGALSIETQSAYSLALWAELFPVGQRQQAAARLATMIRTNGNRMATGFLGTRPLLPVLTANGQHEVALRLFQSREFPSWGYEVVNGATSVWERWNSYTKEGGFHEPAMNSFSHYAFGAMSEWMFQSLAGIDTAGPGFNRIVLRPGPPAATGSGEPKPVEWVKASYRSIHGEIASEWRKTGAHFELSVTVPPNTSATLALPASDASAITEGGRNLERAEGVRFLRMEGGRAILQIGSGSYRFVAEGGA